MERKLKIAFDAKRLFYNREGLGSYARTLISDLQKCFPQHEYLLCSPEVQRVSFTEPFFDLSKYGHLTAGKSLSKSLWRSKTIVQDLEAEKVDVYFGLSNELPFGISKSEVKSVVTIHDVLFRTFPQQFSAIDRWIYQRKFQNAIESADQIIATSQSTREDIEHYFTTNQPIEIAYQAISEVYRGGEKDESFPKEHYIVVGTINDRKNLRLLIEAYMRLPEKERKQVVVVGNGNRYKAKMLDLVDKYGLTQYFSFIGNVDDQTLKSLYKKSIGLVFPSKYEGFGRPIVESLSLGIPVITGANSSLPEVMGKHGIIIEYNRAESLVEAITKMNKRSYREALMIGVENHLRKFDSDTHSKLIMNILTKIIS